jgi:formate C-acetyltransferase
VSKKTPISVYEICTKLTRAGLGFPQYSNDDVVIPALIRYGYAPEDAANYVVAACWEFIVPDVGNDIANIGAVNFPAIVDRAIREYASVATDFDGLLEGVKSLINAECDKIHSSIKDILVTPAHLMSLMQSEKKYNNFGIHGCGIAGAADALYAVKKHIFEKRDVSLDTLIGALDCDFANAPELLHLLRFETEKMGQGVAEVDELAGFIMKSFADALEGKTNCLGGIYRAGTGTAMYYLWHARELGATADGRRCNEAFGTNFSPSIYAKMNGPVSVITSFTANDMTRIMNGGPLTLEFASSVFRSEESIGKVARLIEFFIKRGGHQLQLNSVNLETLKQAQENPELYKNLVVRIWGWSAYFIELDREFQDHVMSRQEYTV